MREAVLQPREVVLGVREVILQPREAVLGVREVVLESCEAILKACEAETIENTWSVFLCFFILKSLF